MTSLYSMCLGLILIASTHIPRVTAEFCQNDVLNQTDCTHGCCGDYRRYSCCQPPKPNKTADEIVVSTVSTIAVIIVLGLIVFCWCYLRCRGRGGSSDQQQRQDQNINIHTVEAPKQPAPQPMMYPHPGYYPQGTMGAPGGHLQSPMSAYNPPAYEPPAGSQRYTNQGYA